MSRDKVVAIIPARGGSKGVPRKNVRLLNGRPVIGYVIEAARSAQTVDHVVVSTDDEEIAEVAVNVGADVVWRPPETASDTAPIDLSLRHALRELQKTKGEFSLVAWLQANVPTTKGQVVDQAVQLMFDKPDTSAVQTVVPYKIPPQWAWNLDNDVMVEMEGCYSYTVLRQQTKQAYHADGSVIVMRSSILLDSEGLGGQAYLGNKRRAIVQDPLESVEIDDMVDLKFCEYLFSEKL